MKKFLLLVLSLSVLAVLSACSDSGSSNNGGGATGPTFTADNLVGTYEVTYFKTVASVSTISTNPADCPEGDNGLSCSIATMYGNKFTIKKEGDNLVAESQMQMYASAMQYSANDVYQYVLYSSMPVADFAQPVTTTKTYTGVSGRNLTSLTSNPDSTFSFTMNADGTITNNLTLVGKDSMVGPVDANTIVVLRKISDTVDAIDKNTLPVAAETITDGNADKFTGFVPNPTAN